MATSIIGGEKADINNPRDAKKYGIETIYQTLALADNVDAAANLYLGRELKTAYGTLDDVAMEAECRKVMHRLNPNFRRFKEPVSKLSGGQRQSVAIARAIHFNARVLIMDEPTAALGPQETAQVGELVKQLKAEGIGIFLISHDIHDVFDLADRVCVMKNGQVVGTAQNQRRHAGRSARHDHSRQVPARRGPWSGRRFARRLTRLGAAGMRLRRYLGTEFTAAAFAANALAGQRAFSVIPETQRSPGQQKATPAASRNSHFLSGAALGR